jgi:serine/threonine protein kinase
LFYGLLVDSVSLSSRAIYPHLGLVKDMARHKLPQFQTGFGIYKAHGIVGEGGAGRVYAAVEEGADSSVAIKLLDPTKATRDRLRRFKNEYLFGFRKQHKNLVQIIDYGIYEGSPFYVMPLYASSLRQVLNNGITHDRAISTFAQILDGVEAAHLLGVVHRDIKPENVLLDSAGNLVIADFGVARFEEEDLYTAVETGKHDRLANFLYSAPEQRRPGQEVDKRADIYAIGLILNELFTGQVPQGEGYSTVEAIAPELAWVDEVVAAMIQSSPLSRPAGVAEVKELLRFKSDQFASRQRLSVVIDRVVPEGELDDPLILDPPRVIGGGYANGTLTIKLSQAVNQQWVYAFQNMGSYSSLSGAEPERFSFSGDEARVSFNHEHVQQVVNTFKQWLPQANHRYELNTRNEHNRKQQERLARENQQRKALLKEERIRAGLTF